MTPNVGQQIFSQPFLSLDVHLKLVLVEFGPFGSVELKIQKFSSILFQIWQILKFCMENPIQAVPKEFADQHWEFVTGNHRQVLKKVG